MALTGSCLCGAVRYAVDRLATPIDHCHCVTCRKAHSAAYNTTAGVLAEHFRWIAGEDKLTGYQSSPGKTRRFCSVCGTQIVAEIAGKPHLVLRVGSLDDDPGTRPVFHFFTADDAPWMTDDGDIPSYPEWPPGH